MTNLTKNDIVTIKNKLHKRQQELFEDVRNELDERENQHLSALMDNDPGDNGDLSLADELADLITPNA